MEVKTFIATALGLCVLLPELYLLALRRSTKVSDRTLFGSWLLVIPGVTLAVWLALAEQPSWAVYELSRTGYACVIAAYLLGTTLRIWSIGYLGSLFTVDVSVRFGQGVVKDGPYRFVRHPSYTGLLTSMSAFAVSLDNGISAIIVVALLLTALVKRIDYEETAMLNVAGSAYLWYQRKTWKLVPFVW